MGAPAGVDAAGIARLQVTPVDVAGMQSAHGVCVGDLYGTTQPAACLVPYGARRVSTCVISLDSRWANERRSACCNGAIDESANQMRVD